MSELVYAYLKLAPWDPEGLDDSVEGKALLTAIAEYFPEHDDSYIDNGYRIIELVDHEASDGTSEFVKDLHIIDLLAPLDVWCQMGDDGGFEWNSHKSIVTPEGLVFDWLADIDGGPILSREQYNSIFNAGGSDAIDLYWDITSRSLGEWIDSAPLQRGVSPAQDAVYQVLFHRYETASSESVSIVPKVH